MAVYKINSGNSVPFAIEPAVRVFESTSSTIAWLTRSGQNIEARGVGLSVTTVNGLPVFGGVLTELAIFSPSGGLLVTLAGIRLDLSLAAAGLPIVDLLSGNDVLSKTNTIATTFDGSSGFDLVDYSFSERGVTASLQNQDRNGGGAAGDVFRGIEGLIGSRFADRIEGNDKRNSLHGGAGADTINGMGGDDVLDGGAGVDVLNGGSGFDMADYSRAHGFVTVNLGDQSRNGGQAAGETLSSIEGVFGSRFADSLIGDNNANALFGGEGADYIYGLGGNDILNGDGGADQINGGAGDDTIKGGAGDDTMVGEAGTDQFDGGLGFDFVSYFNSTGAVTVNLGLNRLNGGQAAGETYTSVEGVFGSRFSDNIVGDNNANALFGGDGADVLLGLGGSDVLKGDGGADRLNGGWGQDTIDGGAGNDTLTGEAGADRFVFGTGWGHDRITDYQRGIDQKLDFTGVAGLDSFSQLAITSGAAGALVTFAGNTLLLAGVHGSALTSSDFML